MQRRHRALVVSGVVVVGILIAFFVGPWGRGTLLAALGPGPGLRRTIIVDRGPYKISPQTAVSIVEKSAQMHGVKAADVLLIKGQTLASKHLFAVRGDLSAMYWLVSLRGLNIPPAGPARAGPNMHNATSMNVVISATTGKWIEMFDGPDPETVFKPRSASGR